MDTELLPVWITQSDVRIGGVEVVRGHKRVSLHRLRRISEVVPATKKAQFCGWTEPTCRIHVQGVMFTVPETRHFNAIENHSYTADTYCDLM